MDTRRQADSLAVSNLTVGTDCITAVISDCQTTCFSSAMVGSAHTIRNLCEYLFERWSNSVNTSLSSFIATMGKTVVDGHRIG